MTPPDPGLFGLALHLVPLFEALVVLDTFGLFLVICYIIGEEVL